MLALRLLVGAFSTTLPIRPDILGAARFLEDSQQRHLKTLFFGSSRLQSAIRADVWARDDGIAPRRVANLAVNDGRLWDALYMLRHGGGVPPSVELVVVEVSTWEFNRNVEHPDGSPHLIADQVRYWGDLGDRLAVDDLWIRAALLGDFVWPVTRRRPLEQWIGPTFLAAPSVPEAPVQHTNPAAAANLAKLEGFRADNIASKHFFDPAISTFTERNLSLLLDELRTVPTRQIVLLQLPARAVYLELLRREGPGRTFYDEVRRLVDSYADRQTHVLRWETPQDCGLGDDIFVDYGHLSLAGAEAFTDRLYQEVEARGWLAPAPVGTGKPPR